MYYISLTPIFSPIKDRPSTRAGVPRTKIQKNNNRARDKRTKIFSRYFHRPPALRDSPQTTVDTPLEEDGAPRGPKEADAA